MGISTPTSLSPISSSVPVVRSIESSHCAMSWVFSVLRTRTERAHRAGRTVTPMLLDPLQPGPREGKYKLKATQPNASAEKYHSQAQLG